MPSAAASSGPLAGEGHNRKICNLVPEPYQGSLQTINRLEIGFTPEEKANPVIVAALATTYGVPLSQLSEVAAKNMEMVRRLCAD